MNKDYVIHNAAGEILRTGNCPEEALEFQAQEGEFLVEGQACCVKDAVDPNTGEIICNGRQEPIQQSLPPQPSTQIPVAQQLDLLWQAMDAGTFPKAEPFYSAIKASKEAQ